MFIIPGQTLFNIDTEWKVLPGLILCDQQGPEFRNILPFCINVEQWLAEDNNEHVAVVHCKAHSIDIEPTLNKLALYHYKSAVHVEEGTMLSI